MSRSLLICLVPCTLLACSKEDRDVDDVIPRATNDPPVSNNDPPENSGYEVVTTGYNIPWGIEVIGAGSPTAADKGRIVRLSQL